MLKAQEPETSKFELEFPDDSKLDDSILPQDKMADADRSLSFS